MTLARCWTWSGSSAPSASCGAALPEVDRALGERLLRLGEPILAYDVVTESLESSPEGREGPAAPPAQGAGPRPDRRHRDRQALLEDLAREPHDDPALREETLGLLARTYKDLGTGCIGRRPGAAAAYSARALAIYRPGLRPHRRLLPRHQRRHHGPAARRPRHGRGLAGRVREAVPWTS